MKSWLAWARSRGRKDPAPQTEVLTTTTPEPVDLIGARIKSALRAAGAKTEQQMIAEMRKRHAAFLYANCPSTVYEFGMAGSAAHYYPACDIVWNASVLGPYPASDMRRAMLTKH
jgi:hypothetical protein